MEIKVKQKFYLDPAIWRDYYENRSDKFRPLGDWALSLINKIVDDGDYILYSDFVIEELKIKYSEEEINNILEIANKRDLLLKVEILQSQSQEAAIICRQRKIAFGDALHAILSRDNNAIMVTRDKHFLELLDVANIKKPEDLI